MKKDISSLRWGLLAAGILAIAGLTGMNVYSLYTLRNSSIESERQSNKLHVAEFADRIRHRFFKPFYGLGSQDMEKIEHTFQKTGRFPPKTVEILYHASKDSIFKNIYYIPAQSSVCCCGDEPILKFNTQEHRFVATTVYSNRICAGMGIARTRMRALIKDYKYNNKVIFDTHRSMVIALVNLTEHHVLGYLAMPINKSYMIARHLQPKLEKYFGPGSQSGITVWLRNWTKNKTIASSSPSVVYNPDKIQFVQQFPDFFNDWRLYVSVDEHFLTASTQNSFLINLIVLGIAFFFLIGALIFMFITAQRERALAQRQSGFLANVTHELKTPLAVIQASGENLADGRVEDYDRIRSYGSHIYSETMRLRNMINQLLDVAKADAGKSFVDPVPISIHQIMRQFLQEHRSYIHEKGFKIESIIPENLPPVKLDKHSLDTILRNLVNNAIKYSRDDKFLGLYLALDNQQVVLKVKDRGIGILQKSLPHIFDKFYRCENTLTAETKGYGLGLSIVKNLVELNGGTIEVSSKKDEGTLFTISFPAIVELTPEKTASLSSLKNLLRNKQNTPDYAE